MLCQLKHMMNGVDGQQEVSGQQGREEDGSIQMEEIDVGNGVGNCDDNAAVVVEDPQDAQFEEFDENQDLRRVYEEQLDNGNDVYVALLLFFGAFFTAGITLLILWWKYTFSKNKGARAIAWFAYLCILFLMIPIINDTNWFTEPMGDG
eukprot:TRINITY_DN336_c0_g1_i1.p3 TRINITY_DN336_c0_g1~~TRINITY_DN336_c0_g1_i1.p3  ORF type:complete len:149 (-),score=49.77 TRINITY_DN336_c0_g1_i1:493-939(-)